MKDDKKHNSPKPAETPQLGVFGVGNSTCIHTWDKDTGIKSQAKPWIGIKSRWIRTCTKCGYKEYYTNDGTFHGWFSTP